MPPRIVEAVRKDVLGQAAVSAHIPASRHPETWLEQFREIDVKTKLPKVSAETVHSHRNAISKFCKFLVRRSILDTNPARLVEVPKIRKTPPRYLTDAQAKLFLRAFSGKVLADSADGHK